jgi:transcriptional regulator with XRE-family HTH domain
MKEILLTDDSVLELLGKRLAARRIALELTQAQLSTEAGVAKRTVERIEAGHSAELITWIRLLRVLGLLGELERLIPESVPGPMQLLKEKKKSVVRKRAPRQGGGARHARKKESAKPWVWGEDR